MFASFPFKIMLCKWMQQHTITTSSRKSTFKLKLIINSLKVFFQTIKVIFNRDSRLKKYFVEQSLQNKMPFTSLLMWYHQPHKQRISLIPNHIWAYVFMQIISIEQFFPCSISINGRKTQQSCIIHGPLHPNKDVNEPFLMINNHLKL
jgi:hypothetical protein